MKKEKTEREWVCACGCRNYLKDKECEGNCGRKREKTDKVRTVVVIG